MAVVRKPTASLGTASQLSHDALPAPHPRPSPPFVFLHRLAPRPRLVAHSNLYGASALPLCPRASRSRACGQRA